MNTPNTRIARALALLLALAAGRAAAAARPFLRVESTATNVVVSETFTVTASLYVPPLEGRFADAEPLVPGRPPRFDIPYLNGDWKSPRVKPVDLEPFLKRLFSNRHRTGFNLNGYRSADPFANMPDPFGVFADSPFGSRQYLFNLPAERVEIDGARWWRFDFASPQYTAASPGEISFGPVSVDFPLVVKADGQGRVQLREMKLSAPALAVTVADAPAEGRPKSYIGAMGRALSFTAALDASVCKAGDPLVLTVEVSGDADLSLAHPPKLEGQLEAARKGAPVFRLDDASVRTETLSAARRFTYRVRPLRAGTFEFPSLAFSYFDLGTRAYVTVQTPPIPVQVAASAQAALSGEAFADAEGLPLPDGFSLDPQWAASRPLFPTFARLFGARRPARNAFTWERAAALAARASTAEDFAALAEIYRSLAEEGVRNGAVYANLGTALVMAGKPYDALRAYAAAERWTGATPATLRGVRAAYARIYDSPNPGLPPERVLFRALAYLTWDAWSLVLSGLLAGALLLAALGRLLRRAARARAARAASRAALWLAAALGLAASAGRADSVTLAPRRPVVGAPCALTLEIEAPEGRTLEQLQIEGLPDADEAPVAYGEVETLTDRKDAAGKRTFKRFRIPVRFLEPYTNACEVAVRGMQVSRFSRGGFSSQSSRSFGVRLGTVDFAVAPLPETGRPATFEGAVGSRFRLSQKVEPQAVRPGDLVTATYRLEFDGYIPSNATVKVEGLVRDFKAYDLKETERKEHRLEWTQVLIPRTTSATNTARVSFAYYNCDVGRYEIARAEPKTLAFLAGEAAAATNTAVNVDGPPAAGGAVAEPANVTVLRLGPGMDSPVTARVPAGAGRTVETRGAWRLVETPDARGWTR